jgi:hypothetical protein
MGTNVFKEPAASHIFPEDGRSMFLQNAGNHLPTHTALYPRRLVIIIPHHCSTIFYQKINLLIIIPIFLP